jgi:Family of unknown function (DUF6527)
MRIVKILTQDGEPWEAKMTCPCGCKEELDMNFLLDHQPRWKASADQNRRTRSARRYGDRSGVDLTSFYVMETSFDVISWVI